MIAPGDYGCDWESLIAQAKKDIIAKINHPKSRSRVTYKTEYIYRLKVFESNTSSSWCTLYGAASNNQICCVFKTSQFQQQT
jgi:hypothetical protein